MQVMNVFHEPSNTTYCDRHYQVLDDQGRCAGCESQTRQRLFVDGHCVSRWIERVRPQPRPDIECAVRRIVRLGHHVVELEASAPAFGYFTHDYWPGVIVVVRLSTNAAVTTLTAARAA
jgi:hypothetical protein